MKRIFLLAGEASGDLQGALLAQSLRRLRPDLELSGIGGGGMERAGVRLLARNEGMGVVGLWEVVGQARAYWKTLGRVREFFARERPDLFVPIDYPDFNFRVLPTARRLGIPVVYYISPQVWAWRAGRIATLRRHIRRMVVIFPFEEALYRKAGVPVTWVGHPLIDRLPPAGTPEEERSALGLSSAGPFVALLPGSRLSEIKRMAPLFARVRALLDGQRRAREEAPVQWILGRAAGLPPQTERYLDQLVRPAPPQDGTAGPAPMIREGVEALRLADLALVASGTVTLEACLLGRPVLVAYRVHPLTFGLAKRMVRVEHIAMANLLAGRRLVPEFVQDQAQPEALAKETSRLLLDGAERARIRLGLLEARQSLGLPGAADRAAAAILDVLEGGG